MENQKYTFFWKTESPFSNWHHAEFVIDGVKFKNTEAHMMWKKAMLFGDAETAEEILKAKHPRDCKAFGRKVKGFDKYIWEENCKQFVYDGNYAKFTQNPALLKALMATGNTEFCEASPMDFLWGVGMSEDNPKIHDKANWKGKNWLGEILTKLRNDLQSILLVC